MSYSNKPMPFHSFKQNFSLRKKFANTIKKAFEIAKASVNDAQRDIVLP